MDERDISLCQISSSRLSMIWEYMLSVQPSQKLASHRTFGINVPQVGKHETLKTAQSGHGCLDAVHGYGSEHSVKCDAVDAVFHQS